MNRHFGRQLCLITMLAALCVGCQPTQPRYMYEGADLSQYLVNFATELEYPDADMHRLAEVDHALPPNTLSQPFDDQTYWDLCLEEAVHITLQNSKVVRNLQSLDDASLRSVGQGGRSGLLPVPESISTVYDSAIVEANPNTGVEGALAAFDAQITSSIFWEKFDRPQNFQDNNLLIPFLNQDNVNYEFQISKRAATGTQLFFRNFTDYTYNPRVPPRVLNSDYVTGLEVGAVQPLLRGRGAQVNRIPVMIARINNDITLAEFEANVRNLVMDVEVAYWDLHCKYKILDASLRVRDKSLELWEDIKTRLEKETVRPEEEARARGQYYAFRSQVQNGLRDVYDAEARLRYLMGLASNDGRHIRPTDIPVTSPIHFDWQDIHCEALVRSPELREQKWQIKQREMELIAARNNLLPDLNATAQYRWIGVGDNLVSSDRNGLNFPSVGSTAWEGLTEGDSQEFRVGLEFAMPVGFRRELAGVRFAQLTIAREKARLEDMELTVSHLLSQSVRDLDALHHVAESHLNQFTGASEEVERLELRREEGQGGQDTSVDFILRAYQRAVAAEIAYYQSACDYSKAIAFVHFRKGSLLEYGNICLAEGPWPKKAYWDAMGHARRRNASSYLNYGWTRPRVISQGDIPQHTGSASGHPIGPHPAGVLEQLEELPTSPPLAPQREGIDEGPLPMPEPTARRKVSVVPSTNATQASYDAAPPSPPFLVAQPRTAQPRPRAVQPQPRRQPRRQPQPRREAKRTASSQLKWNPPAAVNNDNSVRLADWEDIMDQRDSTPRQKPRADEAKGLRTPAPRPAGRLVEFLDDVIPAPNTAQAPSVKNPLR